MSEFDLLAGALVVLKIFIVTVAVIFLVFGLDDLFIDLVYIVRSAWRRWFVLPRHEPLTEDTLRSQQEQPLAVMIPAWKEAEVIGPMLRRLLSTVNYAQLHIFVGTYPNDPATEREVEAVCRESDRVHRVTTGNDGPSCKADCLNWVYQGIRAFEKQQGITFQIFVMQDCEDVVHPLAYRLLNHLIPRKDMVQLPVLPIPQAWHQITSGHYIDEFAQLHYKDMLVREFVNRSIPAAGVGCAFSRRALEAVAATHDNELFNTGSLTEDYDMGFQLRELGLKQIFARFSIERREVGHHWLTGRPQVRRVRELVAVREYFPSTFRTAMRQKARWVLGITMQGWRSLGWQGGLSTRYMLYRDRRALLANSATILGYLFAAPLLCLWLIEWTWPGAMSLPPLVEPGSFTWKLLAVNFVLLAWRIAFRFYCVWRLYGVRQGLLSAPRMVWGSIVNFAATVRALRQFLQHLRTGEPIGWDKTTHVFPSEHALPSQASRLGDLLLQRRLIGAEQLSRALALQRLSGNRRLGEVLIESGLLQQVHLDEVLAAQKRRFQPA